MRRGLSVEPNVLQRATEETKNGDAQAHVPHFTFTGKCKCAPGVGNFFMCTHSYEITISTGIDGHNELQPTCFMFSRNRHN